MKFRKLWQMKIEIGTAIKSENALRLSFFYVFRFGGRLPLLSSLFVDLSQRNFVQGLTIKALARIWKKFTYN